MPLKENHLGSVIWHFIKPYKGAAALCCFFGILAGLWAPFNSLIIKTIIDLLPEAQSNNGAILFVPLTALVLNFIIFDNITWRSISYIWAHYVPLIQSNIMAEMLELSLAQSNTFYQKNLSGKISKQITSLIDSITLLITWINVFFLRGLSMLLGVFIASYSVSPIFFSIMFLWFLIFATSSIILSKKLVHLSDQLSEQESLVSGELVDCLSNHNSVRLFAREAYEQARLRPFLTKSEQAYTKTHVYSTMISITQGALIAIMLLSCGYSLMSLYSRNEVSPGDFALILGLATETGYLMWFSMTQVDQFHKAVGRCHQSLKILLHKPDITNRPDALPLQCSQGLIKFENVGFSYDNNNQIFHNKSITISPGQKVGLVGYSGAGKSTFVNLLLRSFDLSHGRICIDGQDISRITQESLRDRIALIPQDPSLFARTLMDNIRYGRPEASDSEVIEAAKKAHAHDFIINCSHGYDTLVGERGIKLSGGQKQRIAIARAILKNAPILILDESTSQLDSVTEKLIQESLWELMEGKTTLVIAHRLSTILHMDRILVFDKGTIIEDGSHTELLAQNGLYRKFWDTQSAGFLGDEIPAEG